VTNRKVKEKKKVKRKRKMAIILYNKIIKKNKILDLLLKIWRKIWKIYKMIF